MCGRIPRRGASLIAALLLTLGVAGAPGTEAATVKKADDTTVVGPLVALEDGAIVLNVAAAAEGEPPVRTRIPLADVVEIAIDPATDVPAPAPAGDGAEAVGPDPLHAPPSDDLTDFVPIFDGKSLEAWAGDPAFWSVRDGAITGVATEEHANAASTFIRWTGADDVADLELRFRYKIVGGNPGSSGLIYRGQVRDEATFQVAGYQLDLGDDPEISGSLFDEGGAAGARETMAEQGQKVVFRIDGGKDVQPGGLPKDRDAVRAAIKRADWNDVVLTVTGNRFVHRINGNVVADVSDDTPQALLSGVLALQLDFRSPVVVQFKDLLLRRPGVTGAPAPATAPPLRDWVVRLSSGDQLSGALVAWDEKQLELTTAHGQLAIPATQLREVWHAAPEEIEKARATRGGGAGAAATEDVAFARRDGAQVVPVEGLALGIDGPSLRFRFRDQERRIALDKLVGVTLAATADDASNAVADGPLEQSLVLAGGSGDVVSGAWTELDPATGLMTLNTPWGAAVNVPIAKVERVRTRNGRLVYLSDLPPAEVEQVPYFDRVMPMRLDRSLIGGPIKLADAEYARGISVHARTVLRYDTRGRFERLRAKVGFQQPEGKGGRATIRVLGDGDRVIHEITDARGDQPPADLDLDIRGVNRLTLEVDFGADQDVGDRVAWADARLLRAAVPPAAAEPARTPLAE